MFLMRANFTYLKKLNQVDIFHFYYMRWNTNNSINPVIKQQKVYTLLHLVFNKLIFSVYLAFYMPIEYNKMIEVKSSRHDKNRGKCYAIETDPP